jgi:hypothetical protein
MPRQWFEQPFRTARLFALVVVVIVSGPLACLVHCWVMEAKMSASSHEAMHHSADRAFHHPYDACVLMQDHNPHEHMSDAPEAITMAIMPLLIVLSALLLLISLPPVIQHRSFGIFHPPPRDPPRRSFSFAHA